jgi:hypothetical protein
MSQGVPKTCLTQERDQVVGPVTVLGWDFVYSVVCGGSALDLGSKKVAQYIIIYSPSILFT